jgi:hypothetical protein
VGWYAVRKAIHSGIRSTLKVAIGIGLFYGLWAISWWTEPNEFIAAPLEFAAYASITTLLVILAYWLYDRNIAAFKVRRPAKIVIGGLLLAYFVFITIPAAPIAIIVLPILLLIVYMVLRHNAQDATSPSFLDDKMGLPPFKNYLVLLVIPLLASVIYAGAYAQGLKWPTNVLVYLVTTPLGFLLLGISLIKVWCNKTSSTLTSTITSKE